MFRILTAGLLLFTSFTAMTDEIPIVYADTNPLAQTDDGVLKDPICFVGGERILYHPVKTELLWEMGAAIAIATTNPITGKREILFDDKFFPAAPIQFQYWITQHECAHHKMGHIEKGRAIIAAASSLNSVRNFEEDADCAALKEAEKYFTDEDFEVVFDFMANREFIGAASKGVAPTKYAKVAHSWTLEERVQKARECIGRDNSERRISHK